MSVYQLVIHNTCNWWLLMMRKSDGDQSYEQNFDNAVHIYIQRISLCRHINVLWSCLSFTPVYIGLWRGYRACMVHALCRYSQSAADAQAKVLRKPLSPLHTDYSPTRCTYFFLWNCNIVWHLISCDYAIMSYRVRHGIPEIIFCIL